MDRRRAALVSAATALLAVAVFAVLGAGPLGAPERSAADAELAGEALSSITAAADALVSGDVAAYRHAFADAALDVNLYLSSESAGRLPAITADIRAAWRGFMASHEIRQTLDDPPADRVALAELPSLPAAAEEFPAFAAYLADPKAPVAAREATAALVLLDNAVAAEMSEATAKLLEEAPEGMGPEAR